MLTFNDPLIKTLPSITTNDIPTGETFRGDIKSPITGFIHRGLWFKVSGRIRMTQVEGSPITGPVVIRLDKRNEFGNYTIYCQCIVVANYEPVDVELLIGTKSGG